jgi:hypothetical protein
MIVKPLFPGPSCFFLSPRPQQLKLEAGRALNRSTGAGVRQKMLNAIGERTKALRAILFSFTS